MTVSSQCSRILVITMLQNSCHHTVKETSRLALGILGAALGGQAPMGNVGSESSSHPSGELQMPSGSSVQAVVSVRKGQSAQAGTRGRD